MSEIEAPAEPVVEEGVDTRYAWPEGTDPEIAGRYKDPVELARAKREQDATVTRATQEAAEARRELDEYRAAQEEAAAQQPWQDPLAQQLPQSFPPELANRLEMMFNRDPAAAYELAQEAEPGYGPELKNRVMQAWMQVDYSAAMTHFVTGLITPVFDERFQSYEEQLAERLGPTLAHATTQISDAAIDKARAGAPDFDQYEDRVWAMLDPERGGNPALVADCLGSVEKMAARIVFIRDSLAAGDMRRAEVEAAASAGVAPPPAARPRQATIGNGNAARPTTEQEEYAARLKADMKGVKARIMDQ